MCTRVYASFWQPGHTASGWLNLFVYFINGKAGLPPSAWDEIISRLRNQLKARTRFPSLWVKVDSQRSLPILITNAGGKQSPTELLDDFLPSCFLAYSGRGFVRRTKPQH
jgi:hypothetical protein